LIGILFQRVYWDTSIPIKKIKRKFLKKLAPKQKSITDYSVPALTAAQIKKFNKIFSLFFYDTSTSFQRIEHPFLFDPGKNSCSSGRGKVIGKIRNSDRSKVNRAKRFEQSTA
jgi:hypothetical protein